MGYFSEMALNKQEELGLPAEQVSAGNAFEDEETFDELPVPSASHSAASPTVETPSSPAFDADDGAEELAEMNGDDASEAADTDGEDAGKEQEAPAKADATTDADEEKRRAEHEAAEAKRKAEWEARQAEKKKAGAAGASGRDERRRGGERLHAAGQRRYRKTDPAQHERVCGRIYPDQVPGGYCFRTPHHAPAQVNDPLFPVHQPQGVGLHSG